MSRRDALVAGAATAGLAAAAANAQPDMRLPEPSLEFVFQIEASLGTPQELGTVDGMRRRIIPILDGTITGPRLTGKVLPGGADWQGIRPGDGLTRVKAEYWVQAADGAVINISNVGIRRAPADVMKRLMGGEIVAPVDYYFRTSPSFDTGAPAHRWLNESMFLCVGARMPNGVLIRTYLVH